MEKQMKFFRLEEFDCTHTGKNEMDEAFLQKLDQLREACGFPFTITSGYRDATHPNEVVKETPGTHNRGIAADIAVSNGKQKIQIVHEALKLDFAGIGVAKTFIHVDTRDTTPVLWTYS